MPSVSVRYFVRDVDAAIAFYSQLLGFQLDLRPNASFAMLSRGELRLVLSVPGGGPGGGQAIPDGRVPEPGGWNRIQLEVADLDATVAMLRAQGARFRGDVIVGVGVKQIVVEDPAGNPIELDEPTLPEARLAAPAAPGAAGRSSDAAVGASDRTPIAWLLDTDPALRWQVLRDLVDAPADEVAAERARVAREGWGAQLLAAQGADGRWSGGTFFPRGTGTFDTLHLLCLLGLDPASTEARRAIAPVHGAARWDYDPDLRFWEGEVEPCINGRVVAIGAYFGQDVRGIVERLLAEQMADGGWNCEQEHGSTRGSFDTTINVLEGLLAYERATGVDGDVRAARERGEEYLLARRLLRRLSDGVIAQRRWLDAGFPYSWHYDVVRALDYFRDARPEPDERMHEALDIVESRRDGTGRWRLDTTYHDRLLVDLGEAAGEPSRWITLHGLRILRWAGRDG